MPQILRIGPYILFFWSNESDPLEPVHVHISEGKPFANATKIWITSSGKALLCHNNSQLPERILWRLMRIIEATSEEIISKWQRHFNDLRFFC